MLLDEMMLLRDWSSLVTGGRHNGCGFQQASINFQ